ncbi:type IV secretion system protein VirD4 [Kocuria coralli]|uniref:Type IV secretion system protein VirD4 n=1 Tax=Kocuria coralli TaxID=1461025 RepID=A0A5J5KXM1_9MICC|nr:TraM recognition domain-containing protein [Kocuria coralli]KAA9394168.1 type IV secretion system protein VirD4 [Kocuria coralli]
MQNNDDTWGWIIGIAFGLVALVWAGIVGTGALVARVQCGQWPEQMGPMAVINFFRQGGDALATESGCTPSVVGMGVLVGLVLLVVIVATVFAWVLWSRWAESDARLLRQLCSRHGVAKSREVRQKAGEPALMQKASAVRPTLEDPKPTDVGLRVGTSQGADVWITAEDSVVVLGPPRSGKGFFIAINALLDAPGAVVTTSTRGDNVRAVWEARQKIGPCALFDPQGLTKLPSTLKWSPSQGCEDPLVASRRAQAIVGASSMGQSSSNQEWAGVATTILQYLLHAAAIGGVDTPTLGRWGASPGLAEEAVGILQGSPRATPGWGSALDTELNSDPRMLPSKWMGVSSATSSLMLPEVADVLNPAPGEGLDPKTFLENKGSLFLVGTKTGGGAAAPMLIALMDAISAQAREMAVSMPGNRLDPPLSLILDEIANLAPWKELPTIMSDGGGVGISTMVILQSPSNARVAWGEQEAQQILDSATITIQLGGSGNDQELKRLENLMGERVVKERSKTWSNTGTSTGEQAHKEAVITVAELRRLPTGTGLLLLRSARPIVLTMSKWVDRKDADEIKAAIKRFDHRLAEALTAGTDSVNA